MNIKFTKTKTAFFAKKHQIFSFIALLLSLPFICVSFTYAASSQSGLPEGELEEFAQNNILFYDPGECIPSGKFSSICGSTPREKYWSALRQELDEVHAAAVFGSIDNEGSFGTTRWEIGVIVTGDGGTFIRSWDTLYNCDPPSCPGGVGAFGITWTLGPYLRQVNDENPDLLKYFQDPTNYSFPGDETLEIIGDTDYDRLVEQEVKYVLNEADIESFKATSGLEEATDWWTINYENCMDCCGGADYDKSCEQIAIRRASAQKEYEEMKDFSCTASSSSSSGSSSSSNSSSSSTVSGNNITWIGDSYSVQADDKGLLSEKFSGVDIGSGDNNTSSSYIQGSKFVSSGSSNNPSCLTILQDIIDSDKLRPYLVFACGTNGGWSDSDITKFQDMLSDKDTKVIVVNSKIPGNDYADSNNRLKEMADSNDNIYLADWATVYNADYFNGDPEKIHPVTDPGYEKWIGVISDALSSASGNNCGGDVNPTVTVDGNEYMFPLAGASKDNYLHGTDEESMLSPMPCSNYSVGACHHDYVALDMGLRRQKVDGQEKTNADYSDINYDDYYYYSDGIKVLAFVEGEVTYAGYYSNGVPDGYGDKCGQLMYKGVDGNEYWIGHLAYNDSIKAGDKFSLGDVIGEVGPPPCAQGTQSHVHIHISPDSSNNTKLYDIMNAAYEALPETRSASSSVGCGNVCPDGGKTGTSGFSSAEEAANVIITAYESMSSSELGSSYGLALPDTGDYHDNCVAFSTWFINHYTEIFYNYPPNGNQLVDDFYSRNASQYPKLQITDTPTVYSVASWSDSSVLAGSSNHTGIVVGIDEANDKILIAEAGWNNHAFTGVHEYTYTEAKGHGQYINLNDYLKSNTDLK